MTRAQRVTQFDAEEDAGAAATEACIGLVIRWHSPNLIDPRPADHPRDCEQDRAA